MHKVLVNHLFKLAEEKVWLGETDRPAMTIAVDLGYVKQQNKQINGSLMKVKSIADAECSHWSILQYN